MNRLIKLLSSCDLSDITSLRKISANEQGNVYYHEDARITCEQTHKNTPEIVRFIISIPIYKSDIINEDTYIPIADYGLRLFCDNLKKIEYDKLHDSGKEKFTGKIYYHKPMSTVLLRNSAYIKDGYLNLTVKIRFPVHMMSKRNVVAGKLSVRLVRKELAKAINETILAFDYNECEKSITLYKKQCEIRKILKTEDYIAFIGNGSILPRTQINDLPLADAVLFSSPLEDEVTLTLSDNTTITGMAIKQGVSVITGGGYSGKSTMLSAILSGIYDHINGDGREYCITDRDCFKISAEDGRRVSNLDITPFIKNAPGLNMSEFSTEHASGSTSQAANIMESISFGCKVLLIDEDRTATNFMIRDARMKKLIKNDPIIPFTDRVRQLYQEASISTILIIGGSSEYLDIADHVYFMDNFCLKNYKKQVEKYRINGYEYYEVYDEKPIVWVQKRIIKVNTFTAITRDVQSKKIKENIESNGTVIQIGGNLVDVSRIESIISEAQITAILWICKYIASRCQGKQIKLIDEVNDIYKKIKNENFSFLLNSTFDVADIMELPHIYDVLAAISRLSHIVYDNE